MNSQQFLQQLQKIASDAQVFRSVAVENGQLQCEALASAAPAWYRIHQHEGAWNVSLVTPDRWLSESIEADLMHHGDPLEELIEEELVELEYQGDPLTVKHYRSDDMLYTFRSPLAISAGSTLEQSLDVASKCLLAYEAAFRELGDMAEESESTT
jgi:hypothetical protein